MVGSLRSVKVPPRLFDQPIRTVFRSFSPEGGVVWKFTYSFKSQEIWNESKDDVMGHPLISAGCSCSPLAFEETKKAIRK